jgi:hypothetical protein
VDGPSRIRFRIAQEELGLGLVYTVTPFVDGVSLVELARGQEVRPARATKEPDLAGR